MFFNYLNILKEYSDSYEVENETLYWDNVLNNIERIGISNKQSVESDFNLQSIPIELDLYDKSIYKSFNINVEQLITAAFSYTLSKLTNKTDIAFDIENHNRTPINEYANIMDTVGNFDYYYPINIHVKDDLKDHIIEVKENINNIPKNGLVYSINPHIPKNKYNLDILLDYLNYNENIEEIINLLGINILEKEYKDKYLSSDYDLIFNISNYTGKMIFNLFYRNIDEGFVNEIANLFNKVLNDMVLIAKSSDEIKTVSDYIKLNYKGLTKLNNGDDSVAPLFLLYPGHGDSSGYVHLAQKLNKKIPLYAIEPHMRYRNNEYTNGIENLAQEYIKVIKQYQAHGPYNLLGWSYGGVLAFEIANQLKKQGESINNIYLLDSYIITKKTSNVLAEDEEKAKDYMKNSIHELYGNIYNADSLVKLFMDFAKNVKEDMENYKPLFYDDKIKLFKSTIKINPNTLNTEDMSIEELEKNYYNGFDSCVDIKNIKVYEISVNHYNMGDDNEFLEFLSKIIGEDYNI